MRLLLPLLVLCACTTCTIDLFAGDAAGTSATPVVGPDQAVLRLDEVIKNSKLYQVRYEQLKKEQGEIEAQLKQMGEQLANLNGKLEVLSPSSEKHAQTEEEFQILKIKRELLSKRAGKFLDRSHGALLKECYAVLRGHLAAFAKERHIKLVLLAPNADLPNAGSNELLMQLGMQNALYYDATLDITEPFIAFANGRFAATVPVGPLAPATAPGATTAPAPVVAPARP